VTWTGPMGPCSLPFKVDVEACAKEILAISQWHPIQMYNDHTWRVDWRSASLVGYSEDPLDVQSPLTRLSAATGDGPSLGLKDLIRIDPDLIKRTPLALSCPTCLSVADQIPGLNERVRVNYLGPRSIIPKHRDPGFSKVWEQRRIVRFHIPIIRSPGCVFFSWDRKDQCHEICQEIGSVWFVETGNQHMGVNATRDGRYHLVVDKFLNPELRELLVKTENAQRTARS